MSAAQRAVYRLMEKHVYSLGPDGQTCECGWQRPYPSTNHNLTLQQVHAGHLAEVITATFVTLAEHRPTALIAVDVFPDSWPDNWPLTPETVAASAWGDIRNWVDEGYEPVMTVIMEDGSEHEIDLEKVRDV